MLVAASNDRKPVQYYSHAANLQMLFLGFMLTAMSGGGLVLLDDTRQIMAAAGVVLGLICLVYAIARMQAPPMLVLSDIGVDYRIVGSGSVFIPWIEVSHVGQIDFSRSRTVFRDVTVLAVSRDFHAREIVPQLSKLNPNKGMLFSEQRDSVLVALHHEMIGVPAGSLRKEVLARWYAFHSRAET